MFNYSLNKSYTADNLVLTTFTTNNHQIVIIVNLDVYKILFKKLEFLSLLKKSMEYLIFRIFFSSLVASNFVAVIRFYEGLSTTSLEVARFGILYLD